MNRKIENSIIRSNANPSVKSASFAVAGFVSCRNMTSAMHAQNESSEDLTDDLENDLDDDDSEDYLQDPQGDDWIDREDFYER